MDQIRGRSEPATIMPDPQDVRLTRHIIGIDRTDAVVEATVPVERAVTLYLNAQEIGTVMTINDYPDYLALGCLLNQNKPKADDVATEVEYDDNLQVVVRTERNTNSEQKLTKRTWTGLCAGLHTSWLYRMTRTVSTIPSLYTETGATHACFACKASRSATWRTSAAITPSTNSQTGCTATVSIRPTRSSTRPAS